jgi:hypothetical protein
MSLQLPLHTMVSSGTAHLWTTSVCSCACTLHAASWVRFCHELACAAVSRDEVTQLQQLPISELRTVLARDPLALPESAAASSSPQAASSGSITFHGWCGGQSCTITTPPPAQGGAVAASKNSGTSSEAPRGWPKGLGRGRSPRRAASACCSAASTAGGVPHPQLQANRGGGGYSKHDDYGHRLTPPTGQPPVQLRPLSGAFGPQQPPRLPPLLYESSASRTATPPGPAHDPTPSMTCTSSVGTSFTAHLSRHQPGLPLCAELLQLQQPWQPLPQDCMSAIGAPSGTNLPLHTRLASIGSAHTAGRLLQQTVPSGQHPGRQAPRAVGSWSVAVSSAAPDAAAWAPMAQWCRRPRTEASRPAGGAWFGDVALLTGHALTHTPPTPRRRRKGTPSRAAD